MPRIKLDNPAPTRYQKMQVSVVGWVHLGKYITPDLVKPSDFYLFLCKKHGYVTNLLRGLYQEPSALPPKTIPIYTAKGIHRLECPKCRENQ